MYEHVVCFRCIFAHIGFFFLERDITFAVHVLVKCLNLQCIKAKYWCHILKLFSSLKDNQGRKMTILTPGVACP